MNRIVRLFVLITCLCAAVCTAAQAKRSLTPDDVYNLKAVSDPQVSPDGKWVAYVVTTVEKAGDKRVANLWMVPADGASAPKPFLSGVQARSPRWSPDGKQLAFISNSAPPPPTTEEHPSTEAKPKPAEATPKNQVWIVDRDGSNRRPITDFPNGVSSFEWSPDGTRMAVVTRTSAPHSDVKVYTTILYKHDGAGWLNGSLAHIWVVDLKDGSHHQLTSGDDADENSPKWSPDGKWIAYLSSSESPDIRASGGTESICVVPTEGGKPRTIYGKGTSITDPAWSPDAKQLAFRAAASPDEQPLLWIASLDNPLDRKLASDADLFPTDVEWNESGLWFGAYDRGASSFFRVDLSSRHVTKVVGGPRAVHNLTVNEATHRLVYLENDDTHPHDIYSSNFDGSDERQLTSQNADLLSQVEVSPSEPVTWKSVDGLTIHGFLKKPVGWQAGRTYPMILNIHGGPSGMFGYHWELDEQLYAAGGYAVLMTNPRGSSGYGTKFQRAVTNEWGGKAYQDIISGVKAVLADHQWIDRNRLGVVGHSYGGFMTNWIVTQTNMFKAAISMAGISDFISDDGARDGAYGHAHDFGGDIFSNFQEYWKYSPLRLAANVKTPLLLLHGDADQRVPLTQAEEYFRAIKHFGGTAELVIFPGESHMFPLNSKPKHLVETYRWRLYWFDRYVKGNEQARAPNPPSDVSSGD